MQPVLLMILCMMAINAAYALRQFPGAGGRALLQSSHGNLIVDYIGASGASDLQFTDLPISASLQYILPLSFAIDADASGAWEFVNDSREEHILFIWAREDLGQRNSRLMLWNRATKSVA
ncbi:hypothetical protein O6H91_22G039900 [Diphasiastrum complanatum]|uniref:Uncharacterized protein n=1 Tax=Diphasiastrum complanatum TaxID=34168 RepID=A0ACC2AEQ8_DIPCM|nr:hypothetical protein O6H91_22G039900 [Diphasiastrum complanatum]